MEIDGFNERLGLKYIAINEEAANKDDQAWNKAKHEI